MISTMKSLMSWLGHRGMILRYRTAARMRIGLLLGVTVGGLLLTTSSAWAGAVLHPGVFILEIPSALRSIEAASTSTAIFVGETERGAQTVSWRHTGSCSDTGCRGLAVGTATSGLGYTASYAIEVTRIDSAQALISISGAFDQGANTTPVSFSGIVDVPGLPPSPIESAADEHATLNMSGVVGSALHVWECDSFLANFRTKGRDVQTAHGHCVNLGDAGEFKAKNYHRGQYSCKGDQCDIFHEDTVCDLSGCKGGGQCTGVASVSSDPSVVDYDISCSREYEP